MPKPDSGQSPSWPTLRPVGAFLARCGWTALLIVIQPVKLVVSIGAIALSIIYDVAREFVRDLRSIWQDR